MMTILYIKKTQKKMNPNDYYVYHSLKMLDTVSIY